MLYLFRQKKERVTNFHTLFTTFAKELSFSLGIKTIFFKSDVKLIKMEGLCGTKF